MGRGTEQTPLYGKCSFGGAAADVPHRRLQYGNVTAKEHTNLAISGHQKLDQSG